MPPELKKPITCMEQMTCENCVFSVHSEDDCKTVECQCMDSDSWLPLRGEFCDKGQWLWFGKWLYEEHTSDSKETLHVCDYWELYSKFARDVKGNDNV